MFCQWLSARPAAITGCRPKPNGNTPAAPGPRPPIRSATIRQARRLRLVSRQQQRKYQKVGKKKPNPWGLHDMHGNVAEWVLDQYTADFYQQIARRGKTAARSAGRHQNYIRVVRGGSWDDDPRSSAERGPSGVLDKDWKQQDPQLPQSIWYFTDAQFVGFRFVRPLKEPTAEEKAKFWDAGVNK